MQQSALTFAGQAEAHGKRGGVRPPRTCRARLGNRMEVHAGGQRPGENCGAAGRLEPQAQQARRPPPLLMPVYATALPHTAAGLQPSCAGRRRLCAL